MAQADAGAVDVGDFPVEAQFVFAADVLGGKGFVDFHQIEVGHAKAGSFHEVFHGRNRRQAHDRGMAGAHAGRLDPGQRFQTQFIGLVRGHDDHAGGAVVDARGVARGDLAGFGDKGRGQGGEFFHGHARAEMFVLVKDQGIFFPLGNHDRNDFVGKAAVLVGPFRVVVASQGHLVHFLPGDALHLGDEFRGVAHDIGLADEVGGRGLGGVHGAGLVKGEEIGAAVEGVDHGVHELGVLEAGTPPGLGHGVGDAGHVLHPTGQDDVGQAGLDHGHAGKDGFHARDADPVDGTGRDGVGDAGHEGGHPGGVQGVVVLHAGPVSDIVDDGRIDAGPVDGFLHGHGGQNGGVQVPQGPPEGTDGGAAG